MRLLAIVVAVSAIASVQNLDAAESPSAAPHNRLSEGLVGHWKLDEPAGDRAADSSGNGLGATLLNGPKRVAGMRGASLELNGVNQSISIPNSAKLRPSHAITISAWVLPNDLVGTRSIYRKEDSNDRHLLAFHEHGAVLAFGLGLSGGYAELCAPLRPAQLSEDRWHLVAAVYDGAAKRVYWDGAEIGCQAASGSLATAGTAPAFVGSLAGFAEFFDGCLSDLRVYSRALSADEVKQLYGAAADVKTGVAAIRAAWRQAEAKRDATLPPGPARVLCPFHPSVQARWALEGFMSKAPRRVDGPQGYYRTVFDCALLPRVKRNHDRWDLGDCTARAILSWAALREMTGDATTGEVERGQREYLLTWLHPETGLIYYKVDAARKTYHYQTWDQSRTLRGLVRWYQTEPQDRPRIGPLVERMIRGSPASPRSAASIRRGDRGRRGRRMSSPTISPARRWRPTSTPCAKASRSSRSSSMPS